MPADARPVPIHLPFPPASLAGHAKGHWHGGKSKVTRQHRGWAHYATMALARQIELPDAGDIPVHVRFVPPNRRGDRLNFPNRMKPYFDGIAEALGVNDARFVPTYQFAEPQPPGEVVVTIGSDPC